MHVRIGRLLTATYIPVTRALTAPSYSTSHRDQGGGKGYGEDPPRPRRSAREYSGNRHDGHDAQQDPNKDEHGREYIGPPGLFHQKLLHPRVIPLTPTVTKPHARGYPYESWVGGVTGAVLCAPPPDNTPQAATLFRGLCGAIERSFKAEEQFRVVHGLYGPCMPTDHLPLQARSARPRLLQFSALHSETIESVENSEPIVAETLRVTIRHQETPCPQGRPPSTTTTPVVSSLSTAPRITVPRFISASSREAYG